MPDPTELPLLPDVIAEEARKGRGAGLNMASRYDRQTAERLEDGWHRDPDAPIRTMVQIDTSRTILARNQSPDVPFDRSINPYRGCEHGCIYCFARPTHAHLGLSPGLDFETRLLAKPNAASLLEQALARPGYMVKPIAIGTNTDPYQPIEKTWRIMREVLEVLWAHRHPVTVTTKGALVVRDADLLGRLARSGLVRVTISLTTLDNRLSRKMEPRAASPSRRIAAIRMLAQAGIPVIAGLAPVVPGLTDHEVENLLKATAEAGACHATYIALRLPQEVAPLFQEWLSREYPDRSGKVMGRVREMHGGKDYDSTWFRRMKGEGVHAKLIGRRFELACKQHKLERRPPELRTDLFRVPPRTGDQLTLGI